ncbi:MAG: ATP-dependent DNA helicase [Eubacteriales bacterium]|nr:ATP-dependent DNA helicase [Eubacteriales bacterium]
MRSAGMIFRISVRSLVEFLLRSGSLRHSQSLPDAERTMREGARIHRQLQKKEGSGYQAEVPLRLDLPIGKEIGFPLSGDAAENPLPENPENRLCGEKESGEDPCAAVKGADPGANQKRPDRQSPDQTRMEKGEGTAILRLEGRADGIYRTGDGIWTVDEIKTVFGGIRDMEGPLEVHLAQARCYAYMFAAEKQQDPAFSPERIGIRMTYCSQVTEEVRRFYEEMDLPALAEWFRELVEAYLPWFRMRLSFAAARTESIRKLTFPFPYREGQFALAAGVYRTIARGKKLYLQAPTGTGKTLAVLFPALKAVGEGKCGRIFYLTAKTVTGRAALDCLRLLHRNGLCVRIIVLSSRERICPGETVDCRPEHCARAEGHYDRVNDALRRLLEEAASGAPITPGKIAECAREYRVCPYELSLDACGFADIVIGDYNYAFHPRARLARFLEEGSSVLSEETGAAAQKGSILLIDEAHNLLERGREMYSAELSYTEVRRFRKSVRTVWPSLWKALRGPVHVLRQMETQMTFRAGGQDGKELCVLEEGADRSGTREALAESLRETIRTIRWILEQEDRSHVLYGSAARGGIRGGVPAGNNRAGDILAGDLPERAVSDGDGSDRNAARGSGRKSVSGGSPEHACGMQELLDFYFMISDFSETLEKAEEGYIVFAEKESSGGRRGRGISLHLFCANPSAQLSARLEKSASAVFFSATFLPIQYYKGLLGGGTEDYEMYARSSFPPGRQKVVIVRDVTSRYRDRNRDNYARIAQGIAEVLACRKGNYMVFFPSFAFLENVRAAFCSLQGMAEMPGGALPAGADCTAGQEADVEGRPPAGAGCTAGPEAYAEEGFSEEVKRNARAAAEAAVEENRPVRYCSDSGGVLLVQRPGMGDAERAAFLDAFEAGSDPEKPLVGFCVLGGMFGEGIDLREDRLIGSLIVGTGIPPVEPKRELLREYFSREGKNGYDYAYRFPGMNKVLQAAGRVIRTAGDAGVVLLMDGRFQEPANRALFPLEWGKPGVADSREAADLLRQFWKEIQ